MELGARHEASCRELASMSAVITCNGSLHCKLCQSISGEVGASVTMATNTKLVILQVNRITPPLNSIINMRSSNMLYMLSHVQYMSYSIVSYSIVSYSIVSYSIVSYSIVSYSIVSYTVLCPTVSCPTVLCPTVLCPTVFLQYCVLQYCVLYSIVSYSIVSYSIVSYSIVSYSLILCSPH